MPIAPNTGKALPRLLKSANPSFENSMKQSDHNLFTALRAAFPKDLDTVDRDRYRPALHVARSGPRYRHDGQFARLAGLYLLARASPCRWKKSVEAAMLYLATLRAGYVFLPLNTAYQSAEIEYFIGNAEPAVVVCSPKNFGWVSKIAFKAGTHNVFTLGDDRTGSMLDRADPLQRSAHAGGPVARRPGRHPLHQRHHRTQQGCHAHTRQHAEQCAGTQGLLGLEGYRRAQAMC
jgi:hypothetical protein